MYNEAPVLKNKKNVFSSVFSQAWAGSSFHCTITQRLKWSEVNQWLSG